MQLDIVRRRNRHQRTDAGKRSTPRAIGWRALKSIVPATKRRDAVRAEISRKLSSSMPEIPSETDAERAQACTVVKFGYSNTGLSVKRPDGDRHCSCTMNVSGSGRVRPAARRLFGRYRRLFRPAEAQDNIKSQYNKEALKLAAAHEGHTSLPLSS